MIDGSLHHIGVATHDLDRTVAQYSTLYGLENWLTLDVSYEAEWRAVRQDVTSRLALTRWGHIHLEIVEAGQGANPCREWLESRGEGIYHLGYSADPRQGVNGAAPAFSVLSDPLADGSPMAVYFDTVADMGYYVELLHPERADGLTAMIESAGREETTR